MYFPCDVKGDMGSLRSGRVKDGSRDLSLSRFFVSENESVRTRRDFTFMTIFLKSDQKEKPRRTISPSPKGGKFAPKYTECVKDINIYNGLFEAKIPLRETLMDFYLEMWNKMKKSFLK